MSRLYLLIALLWSSLSLAAGSDCSQVQAITHAERTVEQDGRVLEHAEVGQIDTIPRSWRNEATHIRYRVLLGGCPDVQDRGLWVTRIGAPYRAWLDGKPLQALEPLASSGAHVYNGRVPALFMLPVGSRVLDIELATMPYVGSGLIRLTTGPQGALIDTRFVDHNALTTVNDVSSAVIGMVGLLALLLWVMRRQDIGVFWFGAACLTWAVRGVAYFAFTYPMPALVMEQLNPWLILVTASCLTASTLHTFSAATPARRRTLGGVCVAASLGFVGTHLLGTGAPLIRALAFATAFSVMGATFVGLVRRLHTHGSRSAGLLAAGIGALMAGSVHDIGMVIGFVSPDHWALVTPAFTVLLLCQTVVVAFYLVHSLNRAERANEELERNIAAKGHELEQSYALLRESERASARAQERARFNREIHDGLGAQLMTALRGVERGALSKDQVAQSLQDGLDELRLLMDSSDIGRSLYGALVAWRNRWDQRLQAVDMGLIWSIDPALEHLELNTDATLQIMRVLQEAVANSVKHARARNVGVQAVLDQSPPGGLVLLVRDDGQGLPTAHATGPGSGRGLRNMRQRAEKLGGTLVVGNAPEGGVQVRLQLPLPDAGEATNSEPLPLET